MRIAKGYKRDLRPALQPLIAATCMLSSSVMAQTPPTAASTGNSGELTEIVVTGTLIRGVPEVGSSVVSVAQQDIEDTGLATTSDVIRSMPFVSLSGPSEINSQSSSNAANLNTTRLNGVNIRGLGDQATLVLFDGRRVAPEGVSAQLFDPSAIPTIALERIEIVPDGSSATYGSDAVAGVANLILRKNFEGAEIYASDGWSKGFPGQDQFSLIAGHKWDGGSIMVAGDFFSHPALRTSTYANLYNSNQSTYPGGVDQRTPTTYGPVDANSGSDILPSAERHSFVLSAQQDVSETIHLWGEGFYTDRFGVLSESPLVESNIQVPSTNPYYNPAAAAPCAHAAGECNSVTYSFGNQTRYGETQTDQLALGVRFDLPRDFKAEVYYTNNTDKESDLTTGDLNLTALAGALADTNPATALNLSGPTTIYNNPATLSSVTGTALNGSRYTMNLFNGKVDGPIFNLGPDAIRMAAGAEWHRDTLTDLNDYGNTGTANVSLYSTQYVTEEKRTVGSEFLEVLVPIIGTRNAMTGVQSLTLDVAGRHDDYSDFGSTTNPKIGLNWVVNGDLSLRGSYGKSFRAPTLCDINPVCTSTVATFPSADPGAALNTHPFAPGLSVTSFLVGGNSNLKPETARTYSFGADFHPLWLTGLKVSLNYFNIDYKDIIGTPSAFNASVSETPGYQNYFVRNPTPAQVEAFWGLVPTVNPSSGFSPAQVNLLDYGNRQNAGEAKMQGFDLSASYNWDSAWGGWVAGVTSEYVFQYLYAIVPGAPFVESVNEVVGTSQTFPLRFTARGQFGWNAQGFRVNSFVNFHNSYTNIAPPTVPSEEQKVGSYTTVDLTATYDTGDRVAGLWKNMAFGVMSTNLFNTAPPFTLIGETEYDPSNSSPMGRLVSISFRKRFQ
jgi:iron complex outermembrane receptor protein